MSNNMTHNISPWIFSIGRVTVGVATREVKAESPGISDSLGRGAKPGHSTHMRPTKKNEME